MKATTGEGLFRPSGHESWWIGIEARSHPLLEPLVPALAVHPQSKLTGAPTAVWEVPTLSVFPYPSWP